MPPELQEESFQGVKLFPDQSKIDRWRDWRTGLEFRDETGAVLFGALDDLLVKDDRVIPFDYKTKGSPASQESAIRYYQNQLDCYALLVEANGYRTAGYGVLLFYSPETVHEKGSLQFKYQMIKVPTEVDRARERLRSACNLLNGVRPSMNNSCDYCAWFEKMRDQTTSSLFP